MDMGWILLLVGVGLARIGKDAEAERLSCVAALGFGFWFSTEGAVSSRALDAYVRTKLSKFFGLEHGRL